MALYRITFESADVRELNVCADNPDTAMVKAAEKRKCRAIGWICINAHRVAVRDALNMDGRTLDELAYAGSVPACCDEGCEVEPDGTCPHDCPSVFMALGMI